MPIYEYTCLDCESKFEKFVRSFNAPAEVQCPHCGGTHTKKGWSLFGARSGGGTAGVATTGSSCSPGSL